MTVERKFINDLVNEVWPALEVTVINEYTDRLSQRKYGDYRIHIGDRDINIDVKAEENTPDNFPIEIMQDWQSNDIGWYLTLSGCDEIWYGKYDGGLSVYRVSMNRLRRVGSDASSKWAVRRCVKGQGDTIFIAAPITDLIERDICRKAWPI